MAEEKITLTLNPQITEEETVAEPAVQMETADQQQEVKLSPEEQKMVDDFSKQIDVTSSTTVLQYGAEAQKKIADFSDSALQNVRTKDLGEVGEMMADLVGELKGFSADEEEEKGLFGMFKKTTNKMEKMKARYDKAEVNVNKISKAPKIEPFIAKPAASAPMIASTVARSESPMPASGPIKDALIVLTDSSSAVRSSPYGILAICSSCAQFMPSVKPIHSGVVL